MNDNTMPLSPKEYWSNVWQEGVIRFHQKEYNAQMVNFFDTLDLKGKRVLIPLAGKTKDILYFLEKGAIVTAIEFYEGAVIDFFQENQINFTKNGLHYQGDNIHFYACDFFDFKSASPFDVLYDRASQVVFSKETRPKYYQHISTLITPKTLLYLGAINHEGPEDYGPPFKISIAEMQNFYQNMDISLHLESTRTDQASEKMQAAGVNEFTTYFLTNKK